MAARVGSLYVDLVMNSQPFVAGMNRASTATARASAQINRQLGLSQRTVNAFSSSAGNRSFRPYAIIAASRAYETAADRANLLRGSLLALTAVAGGFAAALGTNLLSRYADTAINLNNALRTVTTSTANLTAIQGELEGVAERSRSSFQATVTLYARTARASEKLGLSQEKLLRVTETIQKAFAIGGATSAEAQGAAIQLSQGIASDRFSGEEFRSVAENAPVLLRGMAESLGVNIGRLREMAHAGELTADVVTKAILKASARIEGEFGQTVISLDRAITQVDNKMLEFVASTDKAFGITSLLSRGIVAIGDNLEHIIPPLTQVAALVGAIFLARNRGAIGGGLGAILGGAAGFGLGGIEGAVLGAGIGGFGGFAATRRDENGLGFIGKMKVDAAAARTEVLRLADSQKELRKQVIEAGRAYYATQQQIKTQGVSSFAPKSAQSEVARQQLARQKIVDQINSGQVAAQVLTRQNAALAAAMGTAQQQGAAVAKQTLGEQAALYRNLQRELTETTTRMGLATKASSALSVGLRAVGRAGASLVSLFGGPWGVAITGAALLFAKFAADAQERAQRIANAKRLIDETLQTGPQAAGQGAGSLLSREIEAINENIKSVRDGADAARSELRRMFNELGASDRPTPLDFLKELADLPIQGSLNKLRELVEQFTAGGSTVAEFEAAVASLQAETNSDAFNRAAAEVLKYANTIAGAGPTIDAFRQKIVDLQEAANDPINVLIRTTFDTLDAQPLDAGLTNATNAFAIGEKFLREIEGELDIARLVGDAQTVAGYVQKALDDAEKEGVTVTDAIRARIQAYAEEKVALENRDRALKKAEKDDPYERAISGLREKTALQELENQLYGESTYAIEREKTIRDLENAAIEAKIKLTPELYAAILSEADAYATVAQASEDLEKRRKAEQEQLDFYKNTFSSFFIDIKNDLLEGASLWDTFANAGYNALNKIADRALGLAADGIFDLIFGAFTGGLGGGGNSFAGSFLKAVGFAGGGFTGSGGKFQPAGVVHAGEYVFDAQSTRRLGVGFLDGLRGFANGGYVTPSMPSMPTPFAANSNAANDNARITYAPQIVINGNGVTRGEVDAALRASEKRFQKELPSMLAQARKRGSM